jgi:hypothetical protein
MLMDEIVDYELGQNYPNPATNSTNIPLIVPESTHVIITLTDHMGRVVDIVISKDVMAGYHEVELKTATLSNGIYFYSLPTDKFLKRCL